MRKKSFVAVLSALAISITGMTSLMASATNTTDYDGECSVDIEPEGNSLGSFDYSQSSFKKIRKIPQRLAAKWAGVNVTSTYEPSISSSSDYTAYMNAMNKITGIHTGISYIDAKNKGFCYSQSETNAGYATANPKSACLTYALATALSIYTGVTHTPKSIHPNGIGLVWTDHDALAVTKNDCPDLTESEIMLAIDAQLAMGRPAIIKVTRNSDGLDHWATVITKDSTSGSIGERYTIIDPFYGDKRKLNQMMCYGKNDGTIVGEIKGYAIISDDLY